MKKNYFVKHLIGTLVTLATIFISAGTIYYPQGLLYSVIAFVIFLLNYTILQPSKDLLQERADPGKNSKKWDKKILALLGLNTILIYIIGGLDSGRYHWSPDLNWTVYLFGAVLTVIGHLLFLIAQKQNNFFSSIVRIQENRNHKVHSSGLYKVVRHPGYLGLLLQSFGFPFIFGSLWSTIPVLFSIFLIIIRTRLEDETLKEELDGYKEYSQKTKYRLIPFVW